jgi:hypothetical protein
MMMMILHQMRHGRQDNHATNHVRCTKRARQGKEEGWWLDLQGLTKSQCMALLPPNTTYDDD